MIKTYILQKDLPNLNKGAKFIPTSALAYACISHGEFHVEFNNNIIENNPDWFKEETTVLSIEELVRTESIDFANYFDTLSPTQKCTVHSPSGTGLFQKSTSEIYDDWKRKFRK